MEEDEETTVGEQNFFEESGAFLFREFPFVSSK